ncbi:Tad domain-containing protein [Halobacteriovorax sp. GB3]|uniref:Tad domain-containing protein n=1 Tax=Halobacteriovorax sp. GB3 TaxID=2719615 RepID=UPI0023613314|nr:Tad domain-containing protein [Halobacteriovorax sp. GB3]MDD0851448.1 Tad domain-containing protein [Halobacteriovorax sp. GB3]
MAKSPTKKDNKARNSERGQLSIFLGIVLVVLITMMAFVINVGLFVKAKINLQNAVDAAAWSGAATQARQLSNIGYLNWEMRNTYKEWMFKYYVIGQRGNTKTHLSNISASNMNYRLGTLTGSSASSYDPFNIPSICLHFGSSHNICGIYKIPGLPRFASSGLPQVSEYFESALNTFVRLKANACSTRSDMNFAAAMTWAYGTKRQIFNDAPMLATHRVGAWPQSIELGMRIRNLENIVNRPPVPAPICLGGSAGSCTNVQDLQSEFTSDIPMNERPIKAFMSAYRNLSGGAFKSDSIDPTSQDEFASSFKLTELSPTPVDINPTSLSGVLMPTSGAITKHYLDLMAFPINLVTFFHAFIAADNDNETIPDISAPFQATCGVTKTALPVPAYLFGFVKNPEVMTYYSVKGEANFIGMFFPFTDRNGINLKAYASAKPFGGRIGPMLFAPGSGGTTVTPRQPTSFARSNNYLSALRTTGLSYAAGMPIPLGSTAATPFWVDDDTDPIGGSPLAGAGNTLFAIPNLLYDLTSASGAPSMTNPIEILNRAANSLQANNASERQGLYDSNQFKALLANLPTTASGSLILTAEMIDEALENVRAPTRYEAANYMVPHQDDMPSNAEAMDSLPAVDSVGATTAGNFNYRLYGPLYGQDTLYPEVSYITQALNDYILNNSTAIETFLDSLSQVADSIRSQGSSAGPGGPDRYDDAAGTIHSGNLDNELNSCAATDPKISIAAKFKHFFLGVGSKCDIIALRDSIATWVNDEAAANPDWANFFVSSYKKPSGLSAGELATGYNPGPRQGNDAPITGMMESALTGGSLTVGPRRNFYSTKFIGTGMVDGSKFSLRNQNMYVEGMGSGFSNLPAIPEYSSSNLQNMLEPGQLSEFGELSF